MNYTTADLNRIRRTFRTRKAIRIGIFVSALFLMIGITVLAFPSWELFGMPKLVWAPWFYLVMLALIIGIAVVWRCPACNALLGDVFSTKFCSHCGMRFDAGENAANSQAASDEAPPRASESDAPV